MKTGDGIVRNLLCLVLSIFILLIYGQVLSHDFITLDDKEYVYENYRIRQGLTIGAVDWALTTTYAANWHPLTWMSHMVDIELFGLKPGFHHFTNVLLHIANTLLLFLVLNAMTKSVWCSAFTAALFAFHPLHVESVAWVSERKDVLSAFFWLLTMGSYSAYVQNPRAGRYTVVLICFALGLMAKPMLVTLPFVLLLLDFWPLQRLRHPYTIVPFFRERPAASLVIEKLPLFALSLLSGMITLAAQSRGGAMSSLQTLPVLERIANALVSYPTYLAKTLFPIHLSIVYPLRGMPSPWLVAAAVSLIGAVSALSIAKRNKIPHLFVGWFWFLGTLVPVIGIVQVGYQAMADRYTYIPLVGIFIALAWGVPELMPTKKRTAKRFAAMSGILIAALMAMTWNQVRHWKNSITLFSHALDVTEDNWMAHDGLGFAYERAGRIPKAMAHYKKAILLNPAFFSAHQNLARIYEKQNQFSDAIRHYSLVLQAKPHDEKAHNDFAVCLSRAGRTDESIRHFQKALEIKPDYVHAHYNLAVMMDRRGETEEAIRHFRAAIRYHPDMADAHEGLGRIYRKTGQEQRAAHHFKQVLRITGKDEKTWSADQKEGS